MQQTSTNIVLSLKPANRMSMHVRVEQLVILFHIHLGLIHRRIGITQHLFR